MVPQSVSATYRWHRFATRMLADGAQRPELAARWATIRRCVGSPRRASTKAHGCELPAEGAHRGREEDRPRELREQPRADPGERRWLQPEEVALRGIRRTHRRSLVQCVGMMVLVSAVILVAGREVVRVWARNPEAVPPVALVCVMALYFPMWMWSAVNGNLLNALGKIRWRSRVIIINGLLNLALSLTLVRRLGLPGVALGSLIAMATTEAVVVPLMVRRLLGRMQQSVPGIGPSPP